MHRAENVEMSCHFPSSLASVTTDDNPSGNVQIMGKLFDGVTVLFILLMVAGSLL
jgi:hypothetical protein